MENTVIQYIVDRLAIFVPVLIGGLIITLILYFTGKKDAPVPEKNLQEDYQKIGTIQINIFFIFYLVAWVVLVVIGVLSDFLIPTIVNCLISLIPLLLLIFTRRRKQRTQVEGL